MVVKGIVEQSGVRVSFRERERERDRVCDLGFEKRKGYYGKGMPVVGQFYDVQQHGSKNICTLIKGSNGQI